MSEEKKLSPARVRELRERQYRVDNMAEQIASGRLVVRQLTDEERERYGTDAKRALYLESPEYKKAQARKKKL